MWLYTDLFQALIKDLNFIIIIIVVIYPLTARVVEAP